MLSKLKSLGGERDALATRIKNELFDAEFNDKTVNAGGDLVNQCQDIIGQADALARAASTRR